MIDLSIWGTIVGGLIVLVPTIITFLNFQKSMQKDREEHIVEHAKLESTVAENAKDIENAHDKIRNLERRREEDHVLLTEIKKDIEYIREKIGG